MILLLRVIRGSTKTVSTKPVVAWGVVEFAQRLCVPCESCGLLLVPDGCCWSCRNEYASKWLDVPDGSWPPAPFRSLDKAAAKLPTGRRPLSPWPPWLYGFWKKRWKININPFLIKIITIGMVLQPRECNVESCHETGFIVTTFAIRSKLSLKRVGGGKCPWHFEALSKARCFACDEVRNV